MHEFRAPDLSAPRFRPCRLQLPGQGFYQRLIQAHPRLGRLTPVQVNAYLSALNGAIWQTVIDTRDGVELPEQLGYLFIGSCPRKQGDNPDYRKSAHYGKKIQNQNWESDQYTAKIFYTNFETKYRFRFHELWEFGGVRDFKRRVGQTYPQTWKRYVQVDNLPHVSRLFRQHRRQQFRQSRQLTELEDYDEFSFD